MKFYLVRVMTCAIKGPCFHNYVCGADDIVTARDFANQRFGIESVASVENVEDVSLLPKDASYIGCR